MTAPEAWTILGEELVFDGSPWLQVTRQEVRLPDGRIVDDYYQIAIPPLARVVAETEEDELVLLRQYRHGARRVTLALPGGRIEPSETPREAAQRELLEETGYRAAEWRDLGSYVCNGNQGSSVAHTFLATGARRVREPASGDLEEDEVLVLSRAQLVERLAAGEVALLHHAGLIALTLIPGLRRSPPTAG